jgi:hypothetical protein
MPPSDPPSKALVWLATLVAAVAFTSLGLGLIAAACWYLVPPIREDAAFFARFTVYPQNFYVGQPAKNRAYEVCCVAAPFLLMFAFFLTHARFATCSPSMLRRLIWSGLSALMVLFIWCAVPMVYCPHPPLAIVPPSYLFQPFVLQESSVTISRLLALGGGIFLVVSWLRLPVGRRNLVMVPLLLLWIALAPMRIYAPDEIDYATRYTYHLEPVLHALSQSVNGHHYLVDFPHIYGGYEEILAPFLSLLPRTLEVPLLALAIPGLLGILALLISARLIIRQPVLLGLCGLGLLSVTLMISADPYYCYTLARAVLPSLGILLSILYFRRSTWSMYAAMSVVAAFASVWNLDTGLVLWGSWLATLLVAEAAVWHWRRALIHGVAQTFFLCAAWTLFALYLRTISGRWPDPDLLFYFQSLVLGSGYFCVGLLVPDMWLPLALLYLIGLAAALFCYVRGESNWKTPVTLMLSLLGIGLFSYFMGRSAESNMILAIYPAVLLLGLLAGETMRLARAAQLPASAPFFFTPYLLCLGWWCFLFGACLPNMLARTREFADHWFHPLPTPVLNNAGFVEKWTRPGEDGVCILSDQSGIYYYLSGTLAPRSMPGPTELLETRDMDRLLSAIRTRSMPKLFVEQDFYDLGMYRPDVYQAIKDSVWQNYRSAATDSTGKLTLYVPQ